MPTGPYIALPMAGILLILGSRLKLIREAATLLVKYERPFGPSTDKVEVSEATGDVPFVSLHVPAYSEPPDLVIETISSLLHQDYAPERFEVVLVDNNTEEESMWRPVEKWSSEWNRAHPNGPVMNFVHVPKLAGAKGGALNRCREIMSAKTEFVGVFDADYVVKANFLEDLVPAFQASSRLAFIQTSHDYRDVDDAFTRCCYAEYMPTYKSLIPHYSEEDCGLCVGTMVLFRASAMQEVGPWDEECLSEDTELSIRMTLAGWDGYFWSASYGHGIMVKTFSDYRTQRFRWTVGPLQILFKHAKEILFGSYHHGWYQRIVVVERMMREFGPLGKAIEDVLGMYFLMFLQVRIEVLPSALLVVVMLVKLRLWMVYVWRVQQCGFGWVSADLGRYLVASESLFAVKVVGAVSALVSSRPKWIRTPKFAAPLLPLGVVARGLRWEAALFLWGVLGVGLLFSEAWMAVMPSRWGRFILLGNLSQIMLSSLAAVAMALMGRGRE